MVNISDFSDLISQLPDNPIIAIGGFLTLRKPTGLIELLINEKPNGIIILSLSGSIEIDMLLESGCLFTVVAVVVFLMA